MDLWRLHVFRKVVECRGFSRAAEDIHLSQPTVSSHVKDLERQFGCQLIDKIDKKAFPTREGELLYQYACRLISLKDEAESAMAEFQGTKSGKLRVGGSTIPGGYILPPLIGVFRQAHPNVFISLSVSDTDGVAGSVLSGDIEIGVVGAMVKNSRIRQIRLVEESMKIILPTNHRLADRESVSPKALLRESFIIRERGSGTLTSIKNALEARELRSETLNIVAELGSTTAVIQGIKNGVGISILSPIAVREEINAGTLKAVRLTGVDLSRGFYLITAKGRTPSPLNRVFSDFLLEETPLWFSGV